MNKKQLILASIIILATLLMTSCIAGTNPTAGTSDAGGQIAGFWLGLWHGAIACVTFIVSLFTDSVNVYEVYNSGNWYDFGFMLGISLILSGGGYGAKKKRKKGKTIITVEHKDED
jgi:LPXTG-motif cell wall-anchored protein